MQPPSSARHLRQALIAVLLASAGILLSTTGFARRASISFAHGPDDSESAKELSIKDRGEVFEEVWKDIRDTYYDPEFHGVHWQQVHDRYQPQLDQVKTDAEFYLLLNRMAGELHDAHTRFTSPEAWENRQKFQGVSTGILLGEMDGKIVVTYVYPDSGAAHAGVESGMILVSVNGRPVADAIAESSAKVLPSSTERITRLRVLSAALSGAANTEAKLSFQRADGSAFDVNVLRSILAIPPDVRSHLLPSGNAYIRFDGFQLKVDKEFREALAGFRNAPGLILDLRWNGGGRSDILSAIAGSLLQGKTVLSKTMNRKEIAETESSFPAGGPDDSHQREFKVGKNGDQQYSGPVVILADTRTASSSEVFSGGLQEIGRVKIVGAQTCGCVIGIAADRKMKGGGVLEVSQILFLTPKGRKLEGDGVIPDLAVAPTIEDLQQKRDPALDAAEKVLREMNARKN